MQGINGNGIEAQKQAVARYLKTLDCELVGNFEEVESGANNKRPQLAAAIKLAKSKKAILVIAKLDRLSRNAAFLLQLQDSGIDFVACDTSKKFRPTATNYTPPAANCWATIIRTLTKLLRCRGEWSDTATCWHPCSVDIASTLS